MVGKVAFFVLTNRVL